jgi:hypothetical protein
MQTINNRSKPHEQSWIAIPELLKCLGLLLEYTKDSVRRVATSDRGGKWMVEENFPRLFSVMG